MWSLNVFINDFTSPCLRVKQTVLSINRSISVGVSKFLEVRCEVPEFPQTCTKSCSATFAYKIFSTMIIKTLFWCDLQKGLNLFFCKPWSQFLPGFSGILPGYLAIFPGFSGILPRFSTNQNFWGAFAPPAPRVDKNHVFFKPKKSDCFV